jgi:hypothetical protein
MSRPTVARIIEAEKRRPDFQGGAPVTMADGQVWYLAKPRARFLKGKGGERGYEMVVTLNDAFEAAMERVDAAAAFQTSIANLPEDEQRLEFFAHPEHDMIGAWLAAAHELLRANYVLSDEELDALVQFGFDAEEDPEGYAIRETVEEVARGQGPKRSGGTNGFL